MGVPNPVRHRARRPDLGLVDDRRALLQNGIDEIAARVLDSRLSDGRPWGEAGFVRDLKRRFRRSLTPGRPGRPRKRRGR